MKGPIDTSLELAREGSSRNIWTHGSRAYFTDAKEDIKSPGNGRGLVHQERTIPENVKANRSVPAKDKKIYSHSPRMCQVLNSDLAMLLVYRVPSLN